MLAKPGYWFCCMVCKDQGNPLSECLRRFKPGDSSNANSHLNDKDIDHHNAYKAAKEKKMKSEVSAHYLIALTCS
jgi:hypothetical protein